MLMVCQRRRQNLHWPSRSEQILPDRFPNLKGALVEVAATVSHEIMGMIASIQAVTMRRINPFIQDIPCPLDIDGKHDRAIPVLLSFSNIVTVALSFPVSQQSI